MRALCLAAVLAGAAAAQTGGADSSLTISTLQVPDPPGFLLLGGAPAAVERPATVRALSVTALTRAREGDLFGAFGVEVAPFWLGGIPDLDYADFERGASGLEAVRRTLALSAATDRLDLGGPVAAPAVALGVRASLATGAIDPTFHRYAERRAAAVAALAALNTGISAGIDARRRADPEWLRLDAAQQAAERAGAFDEAGALQQQKSAREDALGADLQRRLAAEASDAVGALDDGPTRRVGVVLDVAAGWAAAFPGADFDALETYRWGAWATAGYARAGTTVLAVARVLSEGPLVPTGPGEALDVGGRLVWDGSGGALSLSGEGVYRLGLSGTADRYRVAGEVAYALSPGRTLAFTLGRDFDGEPAGNVLALLRVVAGFGGDLRALGRPAQP